MLTHRRLQAAFGVGGGICFGRPPLSGLPPPRLAHSLPPTPYSATRSSAPAPTSLYAQDCDLKIGPRVRATGKVSPRPAPLLIPSPKRCESCWPTLSSGLEWCPPMVHPPSPTSMVPPPLQGQVDPDSCPPLYPDIYPDPSTPHPSTLITLQGPVADATPLHTQRERREARTPKKPMVKPDAPVRMRARTRRAHVRTHMARCRAGAWPFHSHARWGGGAGGWP